MQKRTVYLLQDTKELNDSLTKMFNEDSKYEVVGSTTDGVSGVNSIVDKKPDYVILGLVLPGYDGLWVLDKLREKKVGSKVIILSALCREEIISKAMSLGARYFMAKPYNFAVLKERMEQIDKDGLEGSTEQVLLDRYKRSSLDERISKIFINVGIPPHIKGYCFLREGVKMAVECPEIINDITKKLYPMIGEKYQTTASKVERAIRHAIEVAWNRGRIENINNILGVKAYVGGEKPTNGEFIALVADKMLLEMA